MATAARRHGRRDGAVIYANVQLRVLVALFKLTYAANIFRCSDNWAPHIRCSPVVLRAATVVGYDRALVKEYKEVTL